MNMIAYQVCQADRRHLFFPSLDLDILIKLSDYSQERVGSLTLTPSLPFGRLLVS